MSTYIYTHKWLQISTGHKSPCLLYKKQGLVFFNTLYFWKFRVWWKNLRKLVKSGCWTVGLWVSFLLQLIYRNGPAPICFISGCAGCSLQPVGSSPWHMGLGALKPLGSCSPAEDQTCVPYIARQILNYWTTREVCHLFKILEDYTAKLFFWKSSSAVNNRSLKTIWLRNRLWIWICTDYSQDPSSQVIGI